VPDRLALRHTEHGFSLFLAYSITCSTTLGYASGYARDKIRFFFVTGVLNLFTSEESLQWRAVYHTRPGLSVSSVPHFL
jgi:hypothetical protein